MAKNNVLNCSRKTKDYEKQFCSLHHVAFRFAQFCYCKPTCGMKLLKAQWRFCNIWARCIFLGAPITNNLFFFKHLVRESLEKDLYHVFFKFFHISNFTHYPNKSAFLHFLS